MIGERREREDKSEETERRRGRESVNDTSATSGFTQTNEKFEIRLFDEVLKSDGSTAHFKFGHQQALHIALPGIDIYSIEESL